MTWRHRRDARLGPTLIVLALALGALALLGATAPRALAYPSYVHGGISPVACEVCHTDDHTNWPVTSEKCLTCHGTTTPGPAGHVLDLPHAGPGHGARAATRLHRRLPPARRQRSSGTPPTRGRRGVHHVPPGEPVPQRRRRRSAPRRAVPAGARGRGLRAGLRRARHAGDGDGHGLQQA